MHPEDAAFDHGLVARRGARRAGLLPRLLYQFLAATVVLVEETNQRLLPDFLQHFEGRPTRQKRRHQRRRRVVKPIQDLGIILFQRARQPIALSSSLINKVAPLLYQEAEFAGLYGVRFEPA